MEPITFSRSSSRGAGPARSWGKGCCCSRLEEAGSRGKTSCQADGWRRARGEETASPVQDQILIRIYDLEVLSFAGSYILIPWFCFLSSS